VGQAIQLPLALYLLFAPQAEAIQTFVAADVAEHRLNHRHAMTVNRFALLAIDSVFHPVGISPWGQVLRFASRTIWLARE